MMNLISLEDLKIRVDQGDDFKLVMTLGEQAFRMAHIPGSISIANMEQAKGLISPEDEIVVYCHDENCPASKAAYEMLVSHGFDNVRRFAGGIRAWQEAGYHVERDPAFELSPVEATRLSQPITEEDHVDGRIDSPATLVVYGDYECPHTRRTMTHVQGLQRRLGDDFCFVYRHFPAPEEIHPHAWIAAEAALAANAQGMFWQMHQHLFRNQRALEVEDLEGYAAELALDMTRFKQEMHAHAHQRRIERDQMSGLESGVQGVPALFINGIRYEGDLKMAGILNAIENGLEA
jgi:protein-disulfide isomerase/rhodanese-related sulfurtransferase